MTDWEHHNNTINCYSKWSSTNRIYYRFREGLKVWIWFDSHKETELRFVYQPNTIPDNHWEVSYKSLNGTVPLIYVNASTKKEAFKRIRKAIGKTIKKITILYEN